MMNRKKVLYFVSALSLLTCFSSCDKDMDNHILDVVYPKPFNVLYADQTGDSIIFTTFDSYSIRSYAEWISVYGDPSFSFNYDSSNLYSFKRYLNISPNASGHTRSGIVGVNSYEYSTGARYYQVGYVDITHPYPNATSYVISNIPDSVSFALTDSANVYVDSLVFNVQDFWDLSFDSSDDATWIGLDVNHGQGGARCVHISMQPNKDMVNDRNVTLILTTSGVVNKINVRQLKATKEQYFNML